ncbi:hypothetical protein [Nocardiopsis sp. NPDC057823]|uniref:hypothetical protein n=1 Tax=Nocardiopsis sp. NPDC057823 TaxID=3346256 RepID=UPI0036719D91
MKETRWGRTERAVHRAAARARRRLLHTAPIEEMPDHPEQVRDLPLDDQTEFDDIAFDLFDTAAVRLSIRHWGY